MMRKAILTLAAAALALLPCAGQSTFAIFADEATYAACSAEIEAYRQVLDSENLLTTVYHADWQSPDEVKALILKQSSGKRPLEGVVFIGDIPIVMVRQGQHMTTAFKMDEDSFPINESSVASDRFYDDFDLDFEFLQRDTIDATRYYYRLTSKGAQTLRPEIYSARIRVPKFMTDAGMDKYGLIRKFLVKAVAAHKEQNVLDNMTFFFGSGYNSEDLNIWRQKAVAYEECFPHTVGKASSHRFLNFHQADVMKWNLFSELQRPETDFFQFSEHGAPDVQYINNAGPERPDLKENVNELAGSVALGRRGRAFLDSIKVHFDQKMFSDSAIAAYKRTDSIAMRNKDIYQDELLKVRSNPRVIVLNACYNGSFHDPEGYIAGAHIFSDGRCVVAQGNTVNVLQDKLEDKLIGYLSLGLRVGLWQKEVSYLESHIIGDPTFRFTPSADEKKLSDRLYRDLVFKAGDAKVWTKYLGNANPVARSAGIVHLGYLGVYGNALDLMKNDASPMVRMSAFSAIFSNPVNPAVLEEAMVTAFDDPYELIVRNAVKVSEHYCSVGQDSCIYLKVKHILENHREMEREEYYCKSSMRLMDRADGEYAAGIAVILDKDAKLKKRTSSVRMLRNNNYIPAADALFKVIADNGDDEDLRLDCAEALGWYTLSASRAEIVSRALGLIADGTLPDIVKDELEKTVKRLVFK